jgi:hypothetical protein
MNHTLSLFDDAPGGGWKPSQARRTTARELLRQQVLATTAAAPRARAVEALFNGPSRGGMQGADALEAEVQLAWRALLRGDLLLLVDDRQITSLDEELHLRDDAQTRIIYLIPLMAPPTATTQER